jgi:hypothetical protein
MKNYLMNKIVRLFKEEYERLDFSMIRNERVNDNEYLLIHKDLETETIFTDYFTSKKNKISIITKKTKLDFFGGDFDLLVKDSSNLDNFSIWDLITKVSNDNIKESTNYSDLKQVSMKEEYLNV